MQRLSYRKGSQVIREEKGNGLQIGGACMSYRGQMGGRVIIYGRERDHKRGDRKWLTDKGI